MADNIEEFWDGIRPPREASKDLTQEERARLIREATPIEDQRVPPTLEDLRIRAEQVVGRSLTWDELRQLAQAHENQVNLQEEEDTQDSRRLFFQNNSNPNPFSPRVEHRNLNALARALEDLGFNPQSIEFETSQARGETTLTINMGPITIEADADAETSSVSFTIETHG
jgi:hypothetical protein